MGKNCMTCRYYREGLCRIKKEERPTPFTKTHWEENIISRVCKCWKINGKGNTMGKK